MAESQGIKALRSALKHELGDFFAGHGFSMAKRARRFYRVVGDGIVHVVSFDTDSLGEVLQVHLFVFVENLLHRSGMNSLEGNLALYVGDSLGERGMGSHIYPAVISSESERSAVLAGVKEKLERIGFPYFDQFPRRETFWAALQPVSRKKFEDAGVVDAILSGGREIEVV